MAGFALRRIHDLASDRDAADARARALLPKVAARHEWFFRCHDPEGTGLVAIIHPWESGRDNSMDWDAALARVPTEDVEPFIRRDTQLANPAHRPTQGDCERYIALVQTFRDLGWDNAKLHDASPFRVVDPGLNTILIRSCSDLAVVADALGETAIARLSRDLAERDLVALDTPWNDAHGQYLSFDRVADTPVESPSVGGLLLVFAAVPKARVASIAHRIETLADWARHMVPSHDPAEPGFDGKRYWRGPLWLIVNYLIADGLNTGGEIRIAERIVRDSLALIDRSGFAEYYDPITGEPFGGGRFTWTAAMVIEFLTRDRETT